MKFSVSCVGNNNPEVILKEYPELKQFNCEILPLDCPTHIERLFITINSIEELEKLLNVVTPPYGIVLQKDDICHNYSLTLYDDYME